MPHYDELFPGRFLKGTTLERPITIKIVALGGEMLEGDDGEKAKGILKYRTVTGDNGEMVFAKTNAVLTAAVLGTTDYAAWSGRLITIANDPSVMFGKERVGGIRVVGSPELVKPMVVDIKRPRRKKGDRYTLQPTDNQGRVRTSAAPQAPAAQQDPAPPAAEQGSE